MKVSRNKNLFSFTFDNMVEVSAFNDWLDDINIPQAKVLIQGLVPNARTLRRILTKSPSILHAQDDHAVQTILDRWDVS